MKTWVKTLGIISIVLIVFDIISMIIAALEGGFGAGISIVFFLLPLLAIIIGSWLIGFLLVYLRNKNKFRVFAKIISICGLVLFSIIFIISILGLFDIMPFRRWDIADWFLWPFQLIIIIFFIIVSKISTDF